MDIETELNIHEMMFKANVDNELHITHCRYLLNHHKHTEELKNIIDRLDDNYGYFKRCKYEDYPYVAEFLFKHIHEYVISSITSLKNFINDHMKDSPTLMRAVIKRCNKLIDIHDKIYKNEC